MTDIAILGAGSWGTALAIHLGSIGHDVALWGRDRALLSAMRAAMSSIGRAPQPFGQRIIWVQRKSAMVLPVSLWVTTASQSCVVRPRCCARATTAIVPSRAVPTKFDLSSMVVKPLAPSGIFVTQP